MFGDNAALLQIRSPQARDSYGEPSGSLGAVIWEGTAPCHLQRIQKRMVSGGTVTDVKMDSLVVRDAVAPEVEIVGEPSSGSTILVQDQRKQPYASRWFRVRGVENRAADTIADSTRLELDDVGPG